MFNESRPSFEFRFRKRRVSSCRNAAVSEKREARLSCNVERISCARPKPFRQGTRAAAILPATPIATVFPRFHAERTFPRQRPRERDPLLLFPLCLFDQHSSSPVVRRPPFPSPAPCFRSLVAANGPMAEKTAAAIGMRNARLENEPRRSSRWRRAIDGLLAYYV